MKKILIGVGVIILIAVAVRAFLAYQQVKVDVKNENLPVSASSSLLTQVDITANWKTYTNSKYGVLFQYPSEWLLTYIEQNSADDPFGATKILEEVTLTHDLSINRILGTFYINNLAVQGKSELVTPFEYMSYPLSISNKKEWKHINGIPVLYTVFSREGFVNEIIYSIFTSQKEYSFHLYPNLAKQPTSLTQKDLDSIEKVISTFVLSNLSEKFVEFTFL